MIRKKTFFILLISLLLVLSFVSITTSAQGFEPGSILQDIIDRDMLNCGATDSLPGFGSVTEDGTFVGFDIDICRAVAAAILGDAQKVEFIPLTAADRPLALEFGNVDMISRNTTWTLSRVAEWNAIFAPTTFYDGQSVITRADSSIASLAGLVGSSICVPAGTTSELNIRDSLDEIGVDFTLVSSPDTTIGFEMFINNECDAFTTDQSILAALRAGLGDTADDYYIFETPISKEPLGPLSPDRDPEFAEVIAWVVWGLIEGEQLGITSENVNEFANSDSIAIQRFLGIGGQPSGDRLGIPNDFMFQVISQVGNYEEIYNRNLGPDTPIGLERGLNQLYTDGGLLYSPPFR